MYDVKMMAKVLLGETNYFRNIRRIQGFKRSSDVLIVVSCQSQLWFDIDAHKTEKEQKEEIFCQHGIN